MLGFFKGKSKDNIIYSPCKGKVVPITEVSDPTFSEKVLGDGFAVIPSEGKIYAPADGEISMVFDTLHAVTMTTSQGTELLIHIGLDTVTLKGEPFISHVSGGQQVKKGDLLLEADLEKIKSAGFENLKTLASIRERIDDDKIKQTLSDVGLEPDDKRTFRKYSLGMKQRLGIAAAIMEDPDIIILDEPINALDDMGTEQVRDILMKHKERGALIIIACHDADELNFLSDEIIEIAEGRIQNKKE